MTDPNAGETLIEHRWNGSPQPGGTFPVILSKNADIGPMFGRWAWQTAPVINLARDRATILSTLRNIHAAFRDGRADPILSLSATYLREESRAAPGFTFDQLQVNLARDIAANAGRADWVAPLNEEALDLRLCADGRLAECINTDWQPAIHTLPQPNGEIYPFPIFLGRSGGAFAGNSYHIFR
jgi:hypothetical protein